MNDIKKLEERCKEFLFLMNHIWIEEGKDEVPLLIRLAQINSEPGHTPKDLLGAKDIFKSFKQDGSTIVAIGEFEDFFTETGIGLEFDDIRGETYFGVHAHKTYLAFLDKLDGMDEVVRLGIIRKVDRALAEEIESLPRNHALHDIYNMSHILLDRFPEFFEYLPLIVRRHEELDLCPSVAIVRVRKYTLSHYEAVLGGYVNALGGIDLYLTEEEGGTADPRKAMLKKLESVESLAMRRYGRWSTAIKALNTAINLFGKKGEPVISKAKANLIAAMKIAAENVAKLSLPEDHDTPRGLCFFQEELKKLLKREILDIVHPDGEVEMVEEKPKGDKADKIIQYIDLIGLSAEEAEKVIVYLSEFKMVELKLPL